MENKQEKWQGKANAKLTKPTADKVWSLLLEDFCNLHKWIPMVETCQLIHGVPGQPGCIRYCAGTNIHPSESNGETQINWANEKILAIDSMERCLRYEMIENNMGFNSFVAAIKVFSGDNDNQEGCEMEWSFVADAVNGWRLEDLVSLFSSNLGVMAKRMEEALHAMVLDT